MSEPTPHSRYHALDSLRASMMFLGIVLHAMAAYSPTTRWMIRPPETTTALDPAIIFIHAFRMPVFYAMAGFLTALLLERYGWRRATANRFWRIAVPFVGSCLLLVPVMMFLATATRIGVPRASELIWSARFLTYPHPIHLWFLEYLLLLYGLAAVLVVLTRLVPEKTRSAGLALFRRTLQAVWAPLPWAALTFLSLLPMYWPGLADPPSFVPAPHILLAYAIPFFFGWLLYGVRDLLDVLNRRAWLYSALGLALCVAYIVLLYSMSPYGAGFYAVRAMLALAMWCLIFGITGLFLRYGSGYSPLWRYLCDSSYFLYIAHVPVIMALQLAIYDVRLPPVVDMLIVLVVTTAVLLPVYAYAVRPTFLGALLNGRKHPPAIWPAPAAA